MTVLAAFRSRDQSLDYAERLTRYGVATSTMLSPKETKMGCGLCVKFDSKDYIRARAVLGMRRYSAFKGFYRVDYSGGSPVTIPYIP